VRPMPVVVFAVLAALGWTGPLRAQGTGIGSMAPTTAGLIATAHLRLPQSEVTLSQQGRLFTDGSYARAGRRDGEVLMIVGGAVILTGLLADEGLITIAGAAIGGYGLYLYLRSSPKRRGTSG